MTAISIGNALFSKTRQKVLSLLFGRPDQSFYLNEIVRLSDMGKGTIMRELQGLQSAGLILVERIGNQNHFRANKNSPVYDDLRAIVRKTFGVSDVIKSALQPIDAQLHQVFIYGSVARAEDTANSDIDLLLTGEDLAYAEVMGLLGDAEKSLGRTINPTIYEPDQFKDKLRRENTFLTRVMDQPRLWIKGETDDIDQSG